jgi:hypothetical protein
VSPSAWAASVLVRSLGKRSHNLGKINNKSFLRQAFTVMGGDVYAAMLNTHLGTGRICFSL